MQIELLKDPKFQDLLEKCYPNSELYNRTFLPDNFDIPYSSVHRNIAKEVDARHKRTAICATRGIGKTTTARGIGAQAITYCDVNFMVYVSDTATSAEMQTENLKKDLRGSLEIRESFGDIGVTGDKNLDDTFSKKSWVATVGNHQTLVLPRGSGQQVRGLIWKTLRGNFRPDLIIIDDLEDKKLIDNPDQREKVKLWFFGDLLKCIDRKKDWRIFYIDTLKHEDSLMALLLEADDWHTLVAPICDSQYKTLAPDFITDEELAEEVKSHQDKGIMDIFAQEIMCTPISKADATFKQDYFRYYNESDDDFIKKERDGLINVVIVDPAKTVKQHSAESGFVVWGMNGKNEKLFMRYAGGEKLHPDEISDRAIDLALQYNCVAIGIEETGLNEFVTFPLQNELIRRGLAHIQLVPLQARAGRGEFSGYHGGKRARIASMVNFYRRGVVYHNRVGIGPYELQLLGFPKSKRWDIMDAAAYISELLEKGKEYFWFPDYGEEDEEAVMIAEEKKLARLDRETYDEESLMVGTEAAFWSAP